MGQQWEGVSVTSRPRDSGRFDLKERLLDFAAAAIRVSGTFYPTFAGKHGGAQLIHSSASPRARHVEGQVARTKENFPIKLRVAQQALRASRRWMPLAARIPLLDAPGDLLHTVAESEEPIRILNASIRTDRPNAGSRVCEDEPSD